MTSKRCVLESLRLSVSELHLVTRLMAAVAPDSLSKIAIQVERQPSSQDLSEFFSALQQPGGSSALSHIVIEPLFSKTWPMRLDIANPPHVLDLHTTKLLFNFTHLSILRLYNPIQRVTNSLVSEMVSAWPRLRRLRLADDHNESSIDMDGLITFAQCKYLEALYIVFDASTLDTFLDRRPGYGHTCPTLKTLGVGHSPIRNPQAVAAVISDIFPNAYVHASPFSRSEPREPNEYCKLWEDVQRYVQWFTAIRKQERASIPDTVGRA